MSATPSAARRGILLGAIAALAPKPAPAASPVTRERVNAAAEAFANALGDLHGGKWSATVDHTHRFVLIVSRPSESDQ